MTEHEAKRRLMEIMEGLHSDAKSDQFSGEELLDRARKAALEIGRLRVELRNHPERTSL